MVRKVNKREPRRPEGIPSEPRGGDAPGMPPDYVLIARDRFCAWLRWFMETHPGIAPNEAALARQMNVSKPTIHYLLRARSQRTPSFETLLAAERLLGFPVNVLVHSDPPSVTASR